LVELAINKINTGYITSTEGDEKHKLVPKEDNFFWYRTTGNLRREEYISESVLLKREGKRRNRRGRLFQNTGAVDAREQRSILEYLSGTFEKC